MVSMNLSSRDCDGRAVVELRGELDVADAASAAVALTAAAACGPELIVVLAGLEFIDFSGLAALVLARKQAWQAGGDPAAHCAARPGAAGSCRHPAGRCVLRPSQRRPGGWQRRVLPADSRAGASAARQLSDALIFAGTATPLLLSARDQATGSPPAATG